MSGRKLEMYRRTIPNPQCRRIMPLQHEARDLHFFHLTYETLMCLLHLNIFNIYYIPNLFQKNHLKYRLLSLYQSLIASSNV